MTLDKYSPPSDHVREIFDQMGGRKFDQLWTYLGDMTNMLNSKKYRLKESHREELIMFPNAYTLTNKVYAIHYENYDKHFIGILLNSILISTYSLFESAFIEVCLYAADKKNIIFDLKKLKPPITQKCKHFIENEIKIDLTEIDEYWNQLVLVQQLRNRVIHHSSMISNNNKKLIQFIKSHNYLTLEDQFNEKLIFIVKDRLFLFEYIDFAKSYLLWILMRVPGMV